MKKISLHYSYFLVVIILYIEQLVFSVALWDVSRLQLKE